MKNGVLLAAKEINDRGGINGRPVRLHIEDDQGPNPTAAANAVTKLITSDEVVAIIGPHFTPAILPVEPMLAQYKIPALTGASGPIVTQQKNPFVFRVRLNDSTGAALLVQYVLVIAEALSHATLLNGVAVQETLSRISGMRGVMTTYTWSPNGDMVHSGLITRIENGVPIVVKRVSEPDQRAAIAAIAGRETPAPRLRRAKQS